MNNNTNVNVNGNENKFGDINQKNNKCNEITIDKSKKYTIDVENMVLAWANPYNSEAVLYRRLPNINNRPLLEKYYNMFKLIDEFGTELNVTKSMIFYAYVVEKRSKESFTVINLVDEFGVNMAAHVIIKKCNLIEYLNKLIKFRGAIYKYNEDENDKTSETKYSVCILNPNEIEIIDGHQHEIETSPWDMITDHNPNIHINVEDISNKFNKLDIDRQMDLYYNIESKLDSISSSMFGVPNLICPIALNYFLMRDDIYDENVLINNRRHLNILLTILVDYILYIRPKSFDELIKIIVYVVLNYLGYDLESPEDKTRFNEFVYYLGVSKDNADLYIKNAKSNAGGIQEILNYIPDKYKTKPGDIHETATIQFIKRLCIELDL